MQEKGTRGGTLQMILAALVFTICFVVWGGVAALAPVFKELYHLSASQVALLVAVPTLLGSVARFPLGILSDRFGGRLVFSVLMVILLAPVGLMSLTNSYVSVLAVAFFIGLAGASFAIGVPFVSGWFPPSRQGTALGIYGLGTGGTAISALVLPRVANGYGLPYAFLVLLPVLALALVVFFLMARNAPTFKPSKVPVREKLAVIKRKPMSWVLALFYFVTFGGFVALGSYMPTFLVSEYGLTKAGAGGYASLFILTSVLARPLGGILADRVKPTSILTGVFLLGAALQIVLAFQPTLTVLIATFLVIAVLLGLGSGAVFKLVGSQFSKDAGVVGGMVGTIGGLGGFFPPLLMGMVKDATGTYALGFMLLSWFALICIVVNVLVLQRLVFGRRGSGTRAAGPAAPEIPAGLAASIVPNGAAQRAAGEERGLSQRV
ncbi:nitrate/nitrite transporter [Nitrolancea hollandica]|uniref:Nitrite/nitrate transporter n=1 Tax=Nitrolancea hollandica Lb TaxID=1129897 RepID=I4EKJ8_9BACT|nr:nitrate/nitrite transporter [Nitrolancea hollandica]CCF85210.1 Nitrite/nitrate transporter [Nitrolancea hollandica Lb]